jgi:hypothetical protein
LRILRLLALVCFGACLHCPASDNLAAFALSDHDKAVIRLLRDADSLPFEFRADIQLNALEKNPGLPKASAEETLARLFADAPSAQYRFQQREVAAPKGIGTLAGSLETEQELRLDTFSVRARAIRLLADPDPKRALSLLKETAVQVAPVSCSTGMVDDPSGYYDTLSEILPRLWEKTNTSPLERQTFLEQRIDEITSPAQLAPMARLLAKLRHATPPPIPSNLLAQLDDAFAGLLSRTSGSDRELSAEGDNISKSLEELIDEDRANLARTRLLLTSFGDFWKKNLDEPRCADFPRRRRKQLESFDSLAAKYFPNQSVPAIDPGKADTAPLGTIAKFEEVPSFSDVVPMDLLRSMSAYRDTALTNTPPSEETRRNVEDDANHALELAESIGPSDKVCIVCAFEEKRLILFMLFDRAPSEVTRERALDASVKLLAEDETQELSRVQWLWSVHFLLNLAREPEKKQTDEIAKFMAGKEKFFPFLPRPDNHAILDKFIRSGNPVLGQYVAAEKIVKNDYVLPPYVTYKP